MKFSVGLPKICGDFLPCIINNASHISEVYFSWGDFPSGRGSHTQSQEYTEWDVLFLQHEALSEITKANIGLNLLFNANCYGENSLSKEFFCKVGDTIDYIGQKFSLPSVTTTSPVIAKFIKKNFPEVSVRASVNMEIGTVQGMEYLSDLFDGFYIKRELNRDMEAIKKLHAWANPCGKKLYMLVNSGCLNYCSAHVFHDNLVAHESQIVKMDNAYKFEGICRSFLKKEENYKKIMDYTNFIRPEDVEKYSPYIESAKLATRVHKNPSMVVSSYVSGRYSGDLLQILEPAHSIYPYVLENGDPVKIVKISDSMLF